MHFLNTKEMNNLKFFLLGFMLWTATSNAQSLDTRKSFILVGASVEIPKNHTISLYGGYSVEDHIQLTYVASNFKINKILSFTPSYTYMSAPLGRSMEYKTHQVTPSATISIPIDKKYKWIIQNQHSYLHQFVEGGNDTSFYKAKLGLVYRTKIFNKPTNFLLNDEIYVGLKGSSGLTRNKLLTGVQIDLFKWLKPVAMYIFQS